MSSSSEGSASFQKVLANTSGSLKESGVGGRSSSGRQPGPSAFPSKQATTTYGSGKTGSHNDPGSKKSATSHKAAQIIQDTATSSASTPAQAPPQLSTLLPFAGLVLHNDLALADNAAPTAIPVDASPFPAGSGSGVSQGTGELPTPNAEPVPDADAGALVAAPATSQAGASVKFAVPHPGDAKVAVAPDATSTPGTSASGDTNAPLPKIFQDTMPASGVAGQLDASSQTASPVPGSALAASGTSKTGSLDAATKLDTAAQGARAAKTSVTTDRDAKHKAAVSTPGSGNSDGTDEPMPGVTSGGGVHGDDRSDGQRSGTAQTPVTIPAAPIVHAGDFTPVAQQIPAAQGVSTATPNASPSTPDAGSAMAAVAHNTVHLPGGMTEAGSLPAVNNAQLIQSARHAEMRLGMQSDEFGSMSISTSLNRQVLSTQISTEHAELGRVLAAHLPAMEEKLSTAYGLQARVELNSGASSTATTPDGQSQGERQGAASNRAVPLPPGMTAPATTATYPAEPAAADSSRLDIRV